MSMLRVARTCPQSAARTNGRASGRSVWSNRIPIFGDRDDVAVREFFPASYPGLKKKKKRVFACGEAASQTEVPVRRSRAGTESDHNYANTTSFQGGSYFLLLV